MLATYTDADWHGLVVCNERLPEQHQKDRIHAALGRWVIDRPSLVRRRSWFTTSISPRTCLSRSRPPTPVPRSPEEDGEYPLHRCANYSPEEAHLGRVRRHFLQDPKGQL